VACIYRAKNLQGYSRNTTTTKPITNSLGVFLPPNKSVHCCQKGLMNKKELKETVSFSLTPTVIEMIEIYCAKMKVSRSEAVRNLIFYGFNQFKSLVLPALERKKK
jgi:hypothetical protein